MSDIVEQLSELGETVEERRIVEFACSEIEELRRANEELKHMLKLAATWKAEPGVTIAELRQVFSMLDRAALGEGKE